MREQSVTRVRSDGVRSRMLSVLSELPGAERRVADVILDKTETVHRASIGQVADLAATSAPTVLRLARRIGYDGFTDLKMALATDHGRSAQFGAPPSGSGGFDQSVADDVETLRAMRASVSRDAFDRAVDALASAARVFFIGAGSSGALAELAAFRFVALGVDARSCRDPLQLDLELELAPAGSRVVAISHTGSTHATLRAIASARAADLLTIGITSYARSPLAEQADLVLDTGLDAEAHRLDLFTNRVEHLSLLGALHDACAAQPPKPGTATARIAARHME